MVVLGIGADLDARGDDVTPSDPAPALDRNMAADDGLRADLHVGFDDRERSDNNRPVNSRARMYEVLRQGGGEFTGI